MDHQRLRAARAKARAALLAARNGAGHWEGELSSSALSTATAVCALAVVERESGASGFHPLIEGGLSWLAGHANTDGGWGDTVLSVSNISTTTLCWAAFGVVPGAEDRFRAVVSRAAQWISLRAGGIEPDQLAPAIIARYGRDRTFSVPILTLCALAGRLGSGPEAWRHVLSLPFELAALPHHWFTVIRLPVVSYALPALIAIGQARHHHRPTRNPVTRFLRNATRRRTLEVLRNIQPSSGGFLEATPLTSFVTMSLAASGQAEHPVTQKAAEFLATSVRPDGSWPIDTNLATWVTTLSVNALAIFNFQFSICNEADQQDQQPAVDAWRVAVRDWLLAQQYQVVHPYTDAAPGGWAWTDLPGGVPDADDTAGALIALKHLSACHATASFQRSPLAGNPARETRPLTPSLSPGGGEGGRRPSEGEVHDTGIDEHTLEAAKLGLEWLLHLQNRDGGIPTFCRGWTNLPFDRSSPDLTAHAIRAWTAWRPFLPKWDWQLSDAIERALRYLAKVRQPRRGWIPLWFGNQHSPDDENPTYGTAKVLLALQELDAKEFPEVDLLLAGAVMPLLETQREDGSWSGSETGPSSIEETALVVGALAGMLKGRKGASVLLARCAQPAVVKGANWLVEQVENDAWKQPSPIGFYFAKLWYYEKLYPLIFTVGALERVSQNENNLNMS